MRVYLPIAMATLALSACAGQPAPLHSPDSRAVAGLFDPALAQSPL